QRGAHDVREVHAASLEQVAFLDQAAQASSTLGSIPGVAAKGHAVQLLEPSHDARLQIDEIVLDGFAVQGRILDQSRLRLVPIARKPMSRRIWLPANWICSAIS